MEAGAEPPPSWAPLTLTTAYTTVVRTHLRHSMPNTPAQGPGAQTHYHRQSPVFFYFLGSHTDPMCRCTFNSTGFHHVKGYTPPRTCYLLQRAKLEVPALAHRVIACNSLNNCIKYTTHQLWRTSTASVSVKLVNSFFKLCCSLCTRTLTQKDTHSIILSVVWAKNRKVTINIRNRK